MIGRAIGCSADDQETCCVIGRAIGCTADDQEMCCVIGRAIGCTADDQEMCCVIGWAIGCYCDDQEMRCVIGWAIGRETIVGWMWRGQIHPNARRSMPQHRVPVAGTRQAASVVLDGGSF